MQLIVGSICTSPFESVHVSIEQGGDASRQLQVSLPTHDAGTFKHS